VKKTPAILLSYCCPIHNEAAWLKSRVDRIAARLTRLVGRGRFEIILVENGSTDTSLPVLRSLRRSYVVPLSWPARGIGSALKLGLSRARGRYFAAGAIDLPFGFADLETALPLLSQGYDVVYGSKAHPRSQVNSGFKRRLMSAVFRWLMFLLYRIPVRDTQGTIFLKVAKIRPLIKYLTSPGPLFYAQLATIAVFSPLRLIEIPVTLRSGRHARASRFGLKDGLHTLLELLRYYPRQLALRHELAR